MEDLNSKHFLPVSIRVTSTGQSASSPHCSWRNNPCEYNDANKLECADALCKAAGYSGGTFVAASNDFCTVSYTSGYYWSYLFIENVVDYVNKGNEAQITASCTTSGTNK